MRLRLLVVVAFLAMAAVPAYLAWNTGFLPSPQQASAGSGDATVTSSSVVAPLEWPEEPLGLAAGDTRVYWEQRDPKAEVAGIWYHDVRSGDTARLLGRKATGNAGGFPAAGGHLVAWESWAGKRGVGPPRIRAVDTRLSYRWDAAAAGSSPKVAEEAVLWLEHGAGAHGGDVIRGVNSLTDEEYVLDAQDTVTDFAAWGRRIVWVSGTGSDSAVWAGSFRSGTRHRLASRGTAVATDGERTLWTASVGKHSTVVVSWDQASDRSEVLCRLVGSASSLTVSGDHAAWVMDRKSTGPRVWTYDFQLGKASAVSEADGRQVSPVIVADTVYWADDRDGEWALFSHAFGL